MIAVGIVGHGSEPEPPAHDLDRVARVVRRVNARPAPYPTPWLGFGANHNRLVDECPEAEWYVALNPDVSVSGSQLVKLVEVADSAGYDLISPLLREPWGNQSTPADTFPNPSELLLSSIVPERLRRRLPTSEVRVADAAWIGGTCMVIRRSLLDTIRFDERYFMYLEDVDLCRRAWRLGARVGVCLCVSVDHAVGWTIGDTLTRQKGIEYARSLLHYADVHGHNVHAMRAAALLHASVRSVAPGRPPAARIANRAVALGLLGTSKPGLRELAQGHNARYELI